MLILVNVRITKAQFDDIVQRITPVGVIFLLTKTKTITSKRHSMVLITADMKCSCLSVLLVYATRRTENCVLSRKLTNVACEESHRAGANTADANSDYSVTRQSSKIPKISILYPYTVTRKTGSRLKVASVGSGAMNRGYCYPTTADVETTLKFKYCRFLITT